MVDHGAKMSKKLGKMDHRIIKWQNISTPESYIPWLSPTLMIRDSILLICNYQYFFPQFNSQRFSEFCIRHLLKENKFSPTTETWMLGAGDGNELQDGGDASSGYIDMYQPSKRHIGALARLGWLPSFKAARFSRSPRYLVDRSD